MKYIDSIHYKKNGIMVGSFYQELRDSIRLNFFKKQIKLKNGVIAAVIIHNSWSILHFQPWCSKLFTRTCKGSLILPFTIFSPTDTSSLPVAICQSKDHIFSFIPSVWGAKGHFDASPYFSSVFKTNFPKNCPFLENTKYLCFLTIFFFIILTPI